MPAEIKLKLEKGQINLKIKIKGQKKVKK